MPDAPLTGVDLGGTKISAVVMTQAGNELARARVPTPRGDYDATLDAIKGLVAQVEAQAGVAPSPVRPLGIGTPGSPVPGRGTMQNANSTWLNERPLGADLEETLARPVRMANDADCLALSEAYDGAGAGAVTVFAAILGTGIGGGIVFGGKLAGGPLGIAGEWGHNALPRPQAGEIPGPPCWCGRQGCIEAWLSGPALSRDHAAHCGETVDAETICRADTAQRAQTLARFRDRLGRSLAGVINLLDPDVIVLGGGLSRMDGLCEALPAAILPHIFAQAPRVRILPARHGDDSGVRGAARLCAN